jgi:putative nucleotidyltransferase with HDIG domain
MLPAGVSRVLDNINNLKPMPASVTRILQIIEDPQVEIPQIADLIGKDQVLAALVLQMANSVLMGYSRNCVSLSVGVMRIGLTRLRSLMLVSTSYQSMNRALRGYRLGAGELWQHAENTAFACEVVSRFLHYQNVEEAYLAGLIHDIGKLILDQMMLADYARINDFITQYQMPIWEIEKKLIGIDHAQVGSLMGEKWNFPGSLVESIRFHHHPAAAANPILPAIVNLANSITSQRAGPERGLLNNEIDPETQKILGIEAAGVEKIEQMITFPARGTR